MCNQRPAADAERLTDDEAQLAWERQRLGVVETKLGQAKTEIDRWYYRTCAAGWQRSIGVLERRVQEQGNGHLQI